MHSSTRWESGYLVIWNHAVTYTLKSYYKLPSSSSLKLWALTCEIWKTLGLVLTVPVNNETLRVSETTATMFFLPSTTLKSSWRWRDLEYINYLETTISNRCSSRCTKWYEIKVRQRERVLMMSWNATTYGFFIIQKKKKVAGLKSSMVKSKLERWRRRQRNRISRNLDRDRIWLN